MGFVTIEVGDKFKIAISPDDAFDVVDALTMVANDVSSHIGED
jgi:FKBP-type peptidyl-prolyl cis-trans isomerase 2